MAVKIPTYQSQSTANALQSINAQPRAVGGEFTPAVGQAVQQFGHAAMQFDNVLVHKENSDAIANSGKALSDFTLSEMETFKNGQNEAKDGAANFTGDYLKQFDERAHQLISQQTNPAAQKYMQDHVLKLRSQFGASGIQFEAKAAVADRDTKLDEAYQNYARLVGSGSMSYQEAKTNIDTMIANIGYDPITRAERAQKYRERLAESALTGSAERDPAGTKRALDGVYNGGFDHAVTFTFGKEGGYNAKDSNGAAVNMGINQEFHPGVDVKNLTKDQAKQIYKTEYWDKIGGDELAAKNPQLATMAFDTAVISGVGRAKELIAKSGGDTNKFMDLREEFLAGLVKKSPEKFGPYEKAWADRNKSLRADAAIGINPDTRAAIDNLNIDRVPQFINFANSQISKQQAESRSQLTNVEGSHTMMYMNGETVAQPLTQADYVKAFGDIEGPQRYQNYQAIHQLGVDIQAVKTLPVEQQRAFLEDRKPNPNDVMGYEGSVKRYGILAKAIDQVNSDRAADPISYAQQIKVGNVKPLPFNNLEQFGSELSARVGVAKTMQSQYGTPLQLMTKQEAATLTAGFEKMTTPEKLSYIKTMGKSISDPAAYRAVMQQIAPDSPVTAMAGMIMQKQSAVSVEHWFKANDVYQQADVAGIMLEGEALLNKAKTAKNEDGKSKGIAMPPDKDLRGDFADQVGKAFANDPNGADFAFQAVKSYYAGKSAREGDFSGEINSNRLKQAITAVTGGVSDVNGKGDVLRPWGMNETVFNDSLKFAFDVKMKQLGLSDKPEGKFGLYGLQSAGDSKYLLRAGTGYMTDKSGQPVVLDLMNPTAVTSTPASAPITAKPEKSNKLNNTKPSTK